MDEPWRLRANREHEVSFAIGVRKEYGCELGWAQITATETPHHYPPLPKHYAEAFHPNTDILLLLAQPHVSMKYCCHPSVMHLPNCRIHLGGKSTARIVFTLRGLSRQAKYKHQHWAQINPAEDLITVEESKLRNSRKTDRNLRT